MMMAEMADGAELADMPIHRPEGLIEEQLTQSVIGAFFKIHRTLGFGFLESVYASALDMELQRRGHRVQRQVPVAIWYEGVVVARQRLDMIIDGRLILELKSSDKLHPDAMRQLYNYLRATTLEVGLLLHFNRRGDFYRVVCSNKKIPPPTPPSPQAPPSESP